MTTRQLTFQRLPLLLATGLLSTGLLLSGCSNNVEAEKNTDPESNAADTNTENQAALADNVAESNQSVDSTEDKTAIDSDNINPVTSTAEQKSLLTNPTEAGTPEETVRKSLDSLYYGDAKQAATYYKVDMENFAEELAKTQYMFQQTVESVTITDTQYSDDKNRASITGEIMLKGQSESAPLNYELQKIDGQWKILG